SLARSRRGFFLEAISTRNFVTRTGGRDSDDGYTRGIYTRSERPSGMGRMEQLDGMEPLSIRAFCGASGIRTAVAHGRTYPCWLSRTWSGSSYFPPGRIGCGT